MKFHGLCAISLKGGAKPAKKTLSTRSLLTLSGALTGERVIEQIKKLLSPSKNSFFKAETMSGLLLLASAGAAIFTANSRFSGLYETIVHYPFAFKIGGYALKTHFHTIINEGLMSLFFFVVGMEVKRELTAGELSSARKASFPFLAAFGGMLVPALIYYFLNRGQAGEPGWGIPMATDIAFAIGMLSLVSSRVPFTLKIFLLSLAIIDDIGAVLVIALYYSHQISGQFLALACLTCFLISLYFKLGVKSRSVFAILAVSLWVCVFQSGIHATLSGVVLGFLIPTQKLFTGKQVADSVNRSLAKGTDVPRKKIQELKGILQDTHSPLRRLIDTFHPWVSFLIMPLFAFFNAGISLQSFAFETLLESRVSLGVMIGLFIGKPLGVFLISYLGTVLGLSQLPKNVTWNQVIAVGFLAGIGFTMSLFIGNLSFEKLPALQIHSKMSILSASALSALTGLILFLFMKKVPKNQRASE